MVLKIICTSLHLPAELLTPVIIHAFIDVVFSVYYYIVDRKDNIYNIGMGHQYLSRSNTTGEI